MRQIQNLWSHLKKRKKITGKAGSFLGWDHMLIDVPCWTVPEFSGPISISLPTIDYLFYVLLQKDSSTHTLLLKKHLWWKNTITSLLRYFLSSNHNDSGGKSLLWLTKRRCFSVAHFAKRHPWLLYFLLRNVSTRAAALQAGILMTVGSTNSLCLHTEARTHSHRRATGFTNTLGLTPSHWQTLLCLLET